MSITPEEVRRVAALARLELSDAEVEGLLRDLGAILGHVEELGSVEHRASATEHGASEGVEPRGDEPGADPLAAGVETFAPDFREGFFMVPRVASHADPDADRP